MSPAQEAHKVRVRAVVIDGSEESQVRIVFMGTPQFAVPTLQRLCKEGLTPEVVYSQPPRPLGRGLRLTQPPAARCAEELGIPLRQPEILQRRAELEYLDKLSPDIILTVAYGKIFRPRLLALPRLGCVNLHPSLLPRYRGLSPIQHAILRGENTTGVTIYRMVPEVDAGPILAQQTLNIEPAENANQLAQRLAVQGADLMCRILRTMERGMWGPLEQDPHLASFAPRLERDQGLLDWRLPARQICRVVRAMDPWPGTYTYCQGSRVKIISVASVDECPRRVAPGTILTLRGGEPPVIATLPGAVSLLAVQPENSRRQDGVAFCCGRRLKAGDRLLPHPSTCEGRGNE